MISKDSTTPQNTTSVCQVEKFLLRNWYISSSSWCAMRQKAVCGKPGEQEIRRAAVLT